jgi:hypothetical protein
MSAHTYADREPGCDSPDLVDDVPVAIVRLFPFLYPSRILFKKHGLLPGKNTLVWVRAFGPWSMCSSMKKGSEMISHHSLQTWRNWRRSLAGSRRSTPARTSRGSRTTAAALASSDVAWFWIKPTRGIAIATARRYTKALG